MDLRDQLQRSLGDAYTLERELGGGGMSRVFLANETALGRQVVVKVLPPEMAAQLSLERFKREILLAARLQHPHIVPVLSAGDSGGSPYFTMPFVEGESLRARLARHGELPVSEAIRLLREIASALAYAHDRGIVHRDIKPDNVLISGGSAMVTDFGVAKALSASSNAEAGSVTSLGVALGTPAYMSPEQASADPSVDHRADIYAFGVLAYELLTGQPPFVGRTPQNLLVAHVTESPEPIGRRRASLPPALAGLVMRCLEKRPADRVQSAAEIVHALDDITTPSGGMQPTSAIPAYAIKTAGSAPQAGMASNRKVFVAVAVVAAIVAGSVWWRTRDNSPILVVGRTTQLTSDNGLEIQPVISPDGKLVAYSAGNSVHMRVFIRPSGGGRTIPLSDDSTSVETHAQWSPDGNSLLFLSRGGVFVSSALGGSSRAVVTPTPGSPVTSATWSADGGRIAFVRGDSLLALPVLGGTPQRIATGTDLHSCRWSPKDDWIVCVAGNSMNGTPGSAFANLAPSAIVLISTKGGEVRQIVEPLAFNQSPIWSPDGRRLYFISNRDGPRDVYTMGVSPSGRAITKPTRMTTGLGALSISLSESGKRLVYDAYSARANIWALPIPTGAPVSAEAAVPITTGSQVIESLRVSRDGRWLMYDSNINGNADLFRIATTGGTPEQLSNDAADEFAPDLSPDGRTIAFHVWRNGERFIELKSLAGGAILRFATPLRGLYPTWSPDGNAIAFMQLRLVPVIAVVRRESGMQWSSPNVVVQRAAYPVWSPDGSHLAYGAEDYVSKVDSAMMLDLATGAPRKFIQLGASAPPLDGIARWSFDGTRIFYKAHDAEGRTSFWSADTHGGAPQLLVRFPNPDRQSNRADFAVDGTRLYFVIEDRQSDVFVAEMIVK